VKLPVTCAQCMREDIASAMITATVEFRDDGRYEIKCLKGHSSVTLLQQQKFEVLFDIGAYAIVDGYYREAVSSFTSALERFYEFFIKVVCISKGINWEKTLEAWKEVSNQSERQLGAFIFLHLQEIGNKPTLLSNSEVKFRNEVIHKGKIPSKIEAIKYGQAIPDVVRPLLMTLKTNYSGAVGTATFHHLSNTRNPSDDGLNVATVCVPTILSLSNGEPVHDQRSLEDAISQLRRW
jgi:hypothetical protein